MGAPSYLAAKEFTDSRELKSTSSSCTESFPVSARTSSRAAWPRSSLRQSIQTSAPRPANARVVARPRPEFAPVTKKRCPSREAGKGANFSACRSYPLASKEKRILRSRSVFQRLMAESLGPSRVFDKVVGRWTSRGRLAHGIARRPRDPRRTLGSVSALTGSETFSADAMSRVVRVGDFFARHREALAVAVDEEVFQVARKQRELIELLHHIDDALAVG